MSKLIDELLSKGETLKALEECVKSKQYFLGLFILKLKVNNPDSPDYKELVSVILQNTGQEIINEIPLREFLFNKSIHDL